MARRGKVKQVETRDVIDRPARSRKYRYLMLIVCEDENTERVYFEQFHKLFNDLLPSETVYIRAVGTGRNSLGVVNQAIIERNLLATEAGKKVDEVWAVFDKDDLEKWKRPERTLNRLSSRPQRKIYESPTATSALSFGCCCISVASVRKSQFHEQNSTQDWSLP